jgi:hypothetical protein
MEAMKVSIEDWKGIAAGLAIISQCITFGIAVYQAYKNQ